MNTRRLGKALVAGAGACLLSLVFAAPAHSQQKGPAERLGERLDRGIDRLSEEFREGWASLRESVERLGVQGRVYTRLRWDKEIATAEFDVDIEGEGVVVLRGELKDSEAKQKAVQLARDTVGVQRVVDKLSVQPAAGPSEELNR